MERSSRPGFRLGSSDPFAASEEQRELARRLRGRYASPVTIWTAGAGEGRRGLTISSTMIAEGAPPEALGLLGSLSDLLDAIRTSGSFVVHVLDANDRRLADVFAGVYPVDPFAEVDFTDGEFGPVLSEARHFLGCRLVASAQVGLQTLVRGRVESLRIVEEGGPPLIRYRGRYRKLAGE